MWYTVYMVNKEMTQRWFEIKQQLRALADEQYEVEKKLRTDFIKSHTATFTLTREADLNWREPAIVVKTDLHNQVVVELTNIEPYGILNGRNTRRYPKGTKFIVLKTWKKGKTKGIHYLLYDKKTKRVANFYG